MFLRVLVIALFFSSTVSRARDNGQFSQEPSEIRAWIQGLTDDYGASCCVRADGVRPDEADWDIAAQHYRVKIDGDWLTVPESAVVKARNRLGYALVWYHYEFDGIAIRCFLPGSMT
jgi:hypothetical protein